MATPWSRGRHLERRQLYLGEGLTVRLLYGDGGSLYGEAIDLTPEGMGVAVYTDASVLLQPGEFVVLEHTGRATRGLRHDAVITHVTEGTFGGRRLPRIGLSFRTPAADPDNTAAIKNRRRGERYPCFDSFPLVASATSPLFFREWLHFRVRDVGPRGMTLSTSIRNKGLLPGLQLQFSITVPMLGVFHVESRITSIQRNTNENEFRVGVTWVDSPRPLMDALSEYLLLGNKDLTPASLRKGGFRVRSIERAVTFDYAATPKDYEEILELRLRAHQHEGRLTDVSKHDMISPFDKHARHITCRFGGNIVGYMRVIYVNRDPNRSQYVSMGGHEIADFLWSAGFVEAGAGALDPDFQQAGLFLPLIQHTVRVAFQSGYRYLLGACDDKLITLYHNMGFSTLETKVVCPKPGWEFRSHLFYMDMEKLHESSLRGGRSVDAMISVVEFIGSDHAKNQPAHSQVFDQR